MTAMLKYCRFNRRAVNSARQEGMSISRVHNTNKQVTSQEWDAYYFEGSSVHN